MTDTATATAPQRAATICLLEAMGLGHLPLLRDHDAERARDAGKMVVRCYCESCNARRLAV